MKIFKKLQKLKRLFVSAEKFARSQGVIIGEKCSIATKYFGSEPYLIEIGNHVQITSDVRFFTHGGGWVFRDRYPNFDTFGKIKVGNNVYIGNCAMIMPGVIVGDNVIIGSGSVVTKSIPNGCIVAGNPAKIIGKTFDLEKRMLPFNLNSKKMKFEEKKSFLLNLSEEKFLSKPFSTEI